MNITFIPMDRDSAAQILRWRYEPPYDIYNLEDSEENIQYTLNPLNNFFSMRDSAEGLVGFCSFGSDAQVAGGDYSQPALDIGMGIRPDLTGRGMGADFATAVLDFIRDEYAPPFARVTIARFNLRAQRVWSAHLFQHQQTFTHKKTGRKFVVLTRKM